jgi:small GTP-binding protein
LHCSAIHDWRLFRYPFLLTSAHTKPTIAAGTETATVHLGNRTIELNIWDTAGQEVYRGLTTQYYRDAKIGLIVFDLSNEATMKSITEWNSSLRDANQDEVLVVLIGNKLDLPNRKVPPESGEELAAQIGAFYRETSALTGKGVSEVFEDVCEEYIRKNAHSADARVRPDLTLTATEEKNGCC